MDVDSALSIVGGYKRWHIFMFCLVAVSQFIPAAWHGLSIVFIGWEPKHFCKGKTGSSNSNELQNVMNWNTSTNDFSRASTFSNNSANHVTKFMKCHEFKTEDITGNLVDNQSSNLFQLIPCESGWLFEGHGYYTIAEEWNLVCDQNFLVELSQVLFMFGCLVGDFGLSFLIDKYGRKTTHIASHAVICAIGVTNAFSVSYVMFALTRVVMGLFVAINVTSGALIVFEMFDSKHRTVPGIWLEFGYVFCYMALPILAYFIPNWRHLQLATSLFSGLFVFLAFIMPESVLWLYHKGNIEDATKILNKMAKYNGVKLEAGTIVLAKTDISISCEYKPDNKPNNNHIQDNKGFVNDCTPNSNDKTHDELNATQYDKSKSEANVLEASNEVYTIRDTLEPRVIISKPQNFHSNGIHANHRPEIDEKLSLKDVLTDRILLKFATIGGLLWFVGSLGIYSILLSAPSLGRDRFINFLVLGLFDTPFVFLVSYLCGTIGRRLTMFGTLLLGGSFCTAVPLLPPEINGVDMFWVSLTFLIISKTSYVALYCIFVLYTKELFPTNLRSTCGGICQVWGRLGCLVSPLSSYLLKTPLYWLPNIVIRLLTICVGFCVLLMPETKDRAAPETIEDCHKLDESTKFFRRGK